MKKRSHEFEGESGGIYGRVWWEGREKRNTALNVSKIKKNTLLQILKVLIKTLL